MTLVEFIAPLKKASLRDRILAVLYFSHRYENLNSLTVEQIRASLKRARVPKWSKVNVADVLAKSGEHVDSPGIQDGRRLWNLTPTGIAHVQDMLKLPTAEPEVEHDIGSLASLIAGIGDPEVKGFVEEAVKCLRVNALRASIVFLWAGTIRTIQTRLLQHGAPKLNAAIKKHDPKARTVRTIDHFAYVRDKITLLAAQELGDYDKNEKDTLEEGLNLRNRCGHPGKYRPGIKKTSGFVEDMISVVLR
ncbi:MAG TPA: hypothetical protein ENO19_04675 [Halothiobacillaceae bacterium]|nr:hypothetical protein [Halothiobacillaceae bacterium]